MPSTNLRRKAKLTKRSKIAVADQSRRRSKQMDHAVRCAALNLVYTSEQHAAQLPHVISLWNTTADRIEREFGKGFFPVRLEHTSAISFRFTGLPGGLAPLGVFPPDNSLGSKSCALAQCRLLVLSVLRDDPVYGWMSDLLFMSQLPEELILREAGPRNSAWHRRIRKTRETQFWKQAKALADAANDLLQDQSEGKAAGFTRDLVDKHFELERQVRSDPNYKDFAVSRWVPKPIPPGNGK